MWWWKWFRKFHFPLILFCVGGTYGAKILCIASVPTFSHNLFFRPIWKALADRGHQLTVLTTNPMEEPYKNIHEIDLSFAYERKASILNMKWSILKILKNLSIIKSFYHEVGIMEINQPEVQNILQNKSEHFDLVIAEAHIPLMFGFSHRFKCPLIVISSAEISSKFHQLLGNPTHLILYPEPFTPFVENIFWHRIMNLFLRIYRKIGEFKKLSDNQKILQIYFGKDVPDLTDIIRNIQFIFINVHPFFNLRPLGPKFVTIGGGAHITKPKPLPKDLQELLDNSIRGVIYFSLGTNIAIKQYPSQFINIFLEAFRELPYQIIWKFDDKIPNLPNNVKIFRWLPQQDLLRHPNVKAFITQGGLHSTEESIHAGVPIVGMPFMSDQYANIRNVVSKGMGIYLDIITLTKDDLKSAILEIIGNAQYREAAKAVSQLFKDQPMTGLEKSVWYAEYAIRNKNIQHFLPKAIDLPWYQYYILDIIGTISLVLITLTYLIYKLLKLFCSLVRKIYLLVKRKIKND